MANMPSWHVGIIVAALAGSLAVGCGKDDNKGTGSTGGAAGENAGGDTNTGGDTDTGGRGNAGGDEDTGGQQTAGGEAGGGNMTSTAGSAGDSAGGTGNAGGVEETGGEAGTTTGGEGGEATGGTDTGGEGGGETGGEGGGAGNGAGGSASIDDLIGALCDWEFGCCDSAELNYRLGTSAGSVDDCVDDFVFQLHDSNQTNNPYPGSLTYLLGELGYKVDLDRVVENPANIAACIEQYENMDCAKKIDANAHCEGPVEYDVDPCQLNKLFDPGLDVGDRCTLALGQDQIGTNDVECPVGSSCLAADDPDNPENFPSCVQRGIDGQPCTQDGDCDYDFYCNDSGDCTEKGDEGDDCSFNDPSDPQPNDEDASCKTGLSCDPVNLECVANCSEDYPCLANTQCPDGYSCRPQTVQSDANTWLTCQPIGTTAAARCDDTDDCEADRYCNGGICDVREGNGDDCTSDDDCDVGFFCDLAEWTVGETGEVMDPSLVVRDTADGDYGTCQPHRGAGDDCYPGAKSNAYSSGCDPDGAAPYCVYSGDGFTEDAWSCSSSKLDDGDYCIPFPVYNPDFISDGLLPNEPNGCATGLVCEFVHNDDDFFTCTEGASAGDICDDDPWFAPPYPDSGNTCGVGLFCEYPSDSAFTGECVEQVDPAESCEDSDGNADSIRCKNGACVESWNSSGDYICTDAPIPAANGGDNLTCNG